MDIFVINKIDFVFYVGVSLDVMESDIKVVCGECFYILINCKIG